MKRRVSLGLRAVYSIVVFLFSLMSFSSHAALLGRDLDGNSSTYEAFYDDILDITWLADANLAQSNNFGISGINSNGAVNWSEAINWVAAMNSQSYFGFNNWRLPSAVNSELHFLFTEYFGRTPTPSLTTSAIGFSFASAPSADESAFRNIQSIAGYWTQDYSDAEAFAFSVIGLAHSLIGKDFDDYIYAWAVADGDAFGNSNATVVPVPAAVWLFGSGLLGLLVLHRRN